MAAIATPAGPAPVPKEHARLFAPVRAKLWELPEPVHCSVVGTCLSTAQLRKVMARLGLVRPADTEHDLHARTVAVAGQQTTAGRLLHKLLDTTHALAVRSFARVGTEDELRRLWDAALGRGDVPGPYWAVLTHPACSYGLQKEAFGRVHMLSHLVGAANRADLRRLTELEEANAELRAKVERQQERLRQVATENSDTVRALRDALSRQSAPAFPTGPAVPDADGAQALRELAEDLRRRLDASERRVTGLEKRLGESRAALDAEQAAREGAERRAEAAGAELAAAEFTLAGAGPEARPWPELTGVSLLYVGGRPHGVAAMESLVVRLGAFWSHHDGGLEEGAALLPALVSRADTVLFPVDCVSHEAALAVKRLCRNSGKPFVPLRSSGLGSFLAALRSLPAGRQTAA